MTIVEVIILALLMSLTGTAFLTLLLEPARRLAQLPGGVKSRVLHCGGMAVVISFSLLAMISWFGVIEPGGPEDAGQMALVSVPLGLIAGAGGGWHASRTAALPWIWPLLTLAGLVGGVSVPLAPIVEASLPVSYAGFVAAGVAGAGILLAPLGAYHLSALAQWRRRRRYERGACARCGRAMEEGVATCAACRKPALRSCHACRRFVRRAIGEPCPSCRATLGAGCWKCGYDWSGVGGDSCPECGTRRASASEKPERAPAASLG